jgi:2,5-diamino-6-(ribosylamino)-4(3H)-pyrimidinone 5'-phosphate reductase
LQQLFPRPAPTPPRPEGTRPKDGWGYPAPGTRRPIEDPLAIYDQLRFPEPPADRAYVYANMVMSVDGRAVVEGHAAGLGSPVDQGLMLRLRAWADCVLNGAGTARSDPIYRPLPPELTARRRARGQAEQPIWAIATGSGAVEPPEAERTVVFVGEATPGEARARLAARAEVVVAGDERPQPARIARLLRERYGCRRVLLEGGPTLNHAALQDEVIDELFLTLAPKLVAGAGKTIVDGPQFPRADWPRLEVVSLYEHEAELFFRYRVRR